MKVLAPQGNRVIVKLEEKPNPSGIIVKADEHERVIGIVGAVGYGYRNKEGTLIPMTLKTGDKVVFRKSAADKVAIDGEDFYIVNEGYIDGTIE